MLYRFFSRIFFLLKSSNQHGVHSPFIYDFVTKGLYQKKVDISCLENHVAFQNFTKKEQKVLAKIIVYVNPDEIKFDTIDRSNNSNKVNNILFINDLNNIKTIKTIKPMNLCVVIKGIHENQNSFSKWQQLIQNKEATVTIDLFYFGLIFFRKEQVKEHFIIRV